MIVRLASGEAIELGTVEDAPTIGITDYSRREVDAFGVTTVVKRDFSRTMSVRLGLPLSGVDAVQRRLAALRATPVTWVADDRHQWLSSRGYYKDLSLDLASEALSYCTLTIQGLAESEALPDAGLALEDGAALLTELGIALGAEGSGPGSPRDPAPAGRASTLAVLRPIVVGDDALVSINVAEDDHPVWSAAVSYPVGERRIRAHRVYESLVAGNVGRDPITDATGWLDVGPTNRWAMLDQALGTVTTVAGQLVATFVPGQAVTGLALLDVDASTVRVQAPGYDRTVAVAGGSATFLDLAVAAGQAITVTVAGGSAALATETGAALFTAEGGGLLAEGVDGGFVSVGTLLLGQLQTLGLTEANASAGVTDYSVVTTDDFGQVDVVERAWAKKMAAAALIDVDALDLVANRVADLRATPCLWIGQDGLDSLTVYGFWKEFSLQPSGATAKLSLTIEGLSQAAPASHDLLDDDLTWDTLPDPTKTKPANNATNSADPLSPFGPSTIGAARSQLATAQSDIATALGRIVQLSGSSSGNSDAISQALAGLAAEVSRAQGMEGTLHALVVAAQSTADGNTGAIGTETTLRVAADGALSARVDSVVATAGSNSAAISSEAIARADAVSGVSGRLDTLTGTVGGNTATISSNAVAAASATQAVSGRVDTLSTNVGGLSATVSTQAATLSQVAGRIQAYVRQTAEVDGATAAISLVATRGDGTAYSRVILQGDQVVIDAATLLARTIVATKFVTDQGVDLAAIVPGTLSFRLGGGDGGSWNLAAGQDTGFIAWSQYATFVGHRIQVDASFTLSKGLGSPNDDANVAVELWYSADGGNWNFATTLGYASAGGTGGSVHGALFAGNWGRVFLALRIVGQQGAYAQVSGVGWSGECVVFK